MRVRRTKAEIAKGVTVEQKKQMMEESTNGTTGPKILDISEDKVEYDPDAKIVYKYKTKYIEKEIEKEIPIIKEIRILNGTEKTKKTVNELLQIEVDKCIWDWKEVKLDKDFRSTMLSKLGNQGWRMAYIMEWKHLKSSWREKPDSLFFQRPRAKNDKAYTRKPTSYKIE